MEMINKLIVTLLAILLWLGTSRIAYGDPPFSCCYTIQLTASQVEDCSGNGQLQPVIVTALETATVTLQFDTSLAGTEVVVQALDGGALGISGSAIIDQNGNLSFPFQISDQPGLYRISVVADMGSGSVPLSLVQFQLPNPEQ
jgi:hypothetical protein